ncbi:MAG: hypothetical protein GX946_02365 [Oligosphaeraceae bacterium]|nr:hypothetical protein [Oligosphaeraceae bacterium]
MKLRILDITLPDSLEPIASALPQLGNMPIAGGSLAELLRTEAAALPSRLFLSLSPTLWPSSELWQILAQQEQPCRLLSAQGELLGWLNEDDELPAMGCKEIMPDATSLLIRYPWDLLTLTERLIGAFSEDRLLGIVREGVSRDGFLYLGEGSVILPGVYIEGNVSIGKHCKIGPNCHLRGNTSIADHCHIGNAVEIKNSLLFEHVAVGHLSYVGDSVICQNTNFGAGSICSNLRHDGKNHCCPINGEKIDSGRQKLGAFIGANVKLGINTSIYPGRKLYSNSSTRPAEVVQKDLKV